MVADKCAEMKKRRTRHIRKNRADQQARDTQGAAVVMTLKAIVAPHELGLRGTPLIDRVKDDSLARINGGDLQHVTPPYPSHRDIVVEVERSGNSRIDPRCLETGFREYQHLRRDGGVQVSQNRRQIAENRMEFQFR